MMKIYTDGACSNNGKTYAKAGYALIISGTKISSGIAYSGKLRPNKYYIKGGKIFPTKEVCPVTNIRAEMMAIILALYYGGDIIEIVTDSEFTIKVATEWMSNWKASGYFGTNKKKNMDLVEILYILSENKKIKYTHQKSHVKNPTTENEIGNDMVDKLAAKAQDYPDFKISKLIL